MPEAQQSLPTGKIDLNRGCIKRKDKDSGIEVYMYKDDPGVYYTPTGEKVSTAMAKKAGYDTGQLAVDKARLDKLSEAQDRINAEFGVTDVGNAFEAGGFAARHIGLDRYHVFDATNTQLTREPCTKDQAIDLVRELSTIDNEVPEGEEKAAA